MPKGKIKKAVSRNVQTKKFHQLTVLAEIEKEVEWKNDADLKKQTDELSVVVMDDFKDTYTKILAELDLVEKRGFIESLGSGVGVQQVTPVTDKDVESATIEEIFEGA